MLKNKRETQCFGGPEPAGSADCAVDYREKRHADDTDHGACRNSMTTRDFCRLLERSLAIVRRAGPGLGTAAGRYEDAAI